MNTKIFTQLLLYVRDYAEYLSSWNISPKVILNPKSKLLSERTKIHDSLAWKIWVLNHWVILPFSHTEICSLFTQQNINLAGIDFTCLFARFSVNQITTLRLLKCYTWNACYLMLYTIFLSNLEWKAQVTTKKFSQRKSHIFKHVFAILFVNSKVLVA